MSNNTHMARVNRYAGFSRYQEPFKRCATRRTLASIVLIATLFSGSYSSFAESVKPDGECPIMYPTEPIHIGSHGASLKVLPNSVDLAIISQIESSNNPRAYNRNSGATGKYQITKVCLDDFKLAHRGCPFTMQDMYDPEINEEVADWYIRKRLPDLLRHFRLPVNPTNIIRAYNAGIKSVIDGRIPKETAEYLAKYQRLGGVL